MTNKARTHDWNLKIYEIDILLDLEKNELRISVVGEASDSRNQEVRLWGFEEKSPLGWVPHFNMCDPGTSIRIARIPITWYALPKVIKFE